MVTSRFGSQRGLPLSKQQARQANNEPIVCDLAGSLQHMAMEVLNMLYTLAVILLIAWLLGLVGTYTIGAFVHVLLVIAIVLFLAGLLSGRTVV
jgi:Na+/H+-dicarboxylate symporter